ncbi:AAA family ATPase [Microcoleus sp. MOSTC5]|uniref:AAA family ATPase n=1 Tax=Microcoleus sp. MOSTC5 TaxID=3055378 RepID=UPI002FD2F280
MRLHWLWIGEYKNLKNVTIDFDQGEWITVVIGWNGTGKSNVLEALATIFRDLITGENDNKNKNKPSFHYRIKYRCRNNFMHIDADPKRVNKPYQIYVSAEDRDEAQEIINQGSISGIESEIQDKDLGESITINQLRKNQDQYLPKYIFGYYSGESDRMEKVFRKYLAGYDKDLRDGKDREFKRLFYALPVHSQFVLLAFIHQQDSVVREFLDNQLGLDPDNGIDSILFVLHQPPWKSKEGDPRFWNARGIVSSFLARLYDVSLAPIRITRQVGVSLWNKQRLEFLYLYIKNLDSLQRLIGQKSPKEFFRDLESTYVSELIEEVRIRIKLRKNDGSVTFRELSEGEQQLLTVLGLLRFTAEEESLFLLDEPDTHLNPRWSIDYLKYLEKFVGNDQASRESCHVVLTTHNPLAIAELLKQQIQILKRDMDDLSISVTPPEIDPRGMGYAAIVTSDMFGLPAAIDRSTLKLLEKKRELTVKEEQLNDEERSDLEEVNQKLEGYGFGYETRDPIYTEYLRARYEYDAAQNVSQQMSNLSLSERKARAKRLVERALARRQNQD